MVTLNKNYKKINGISETVSVIDDRHNTAMSEIETDMESIETAFDNKVDKDGSKGLSTNDYSTVDKTKLAGIEPGAEVNVNADWTASGTSAEILNKPTIPSSINDLTDVDAAGVSNGEILKFDGTSFVNDQYATDEFAIHNNIDSEIQAVTQKATPSNDDLILIEDSLDSYNKKSLKISNLPGGASGSDTTAIHDDTAGEINAITEKTTPTTDDWIIIEDSADSNNKKKVKLGNTPGNSYTGDMAKSTYDTDDNGIVDKAESVDDGTNTTSASQVKSAYDHSVVTTGNPHSVTKTDVGLGNVDNTSDANKPVSTATQTALDNKIDKTTGIAANRIAAFDGSDGLKDTGILYEEVDDHIVNSNNPHSVTKTQVGLSNVDNTADIDKPVSTYQLIALNNKANKNNVLLLDNTTAFTPNADYEPATKKYVDEKYDGKIQESSEPADPASGFAVRWIDEATGDYKIKINHGGTVKTAILVDFSAL